MPVSATSLVAHTDPSDIIPLECKRAFLASGAAWPGEGPPDCVETHASFVFLTRDRVWKLKKAIRLPHVDMRDPDIRENLCREELRLNRALAGDIYRGMVPLVRRPDGGLALGGAGQVIDWLIEMQRLPAPAFLDARLKSGRTPRLGEITAVCDRMIRFYREQPAPPEAGRTMFDLRLREAETNALHLRELRSRIGADLPDALLDRGVRLLETCKDEVLSRARQGFVVEGHGDLRPEHVCLTDPPVIFDRLEYDPAMLLTDPWSELNALGLECAQLGAAWIRPILLFSLARSGYAAPSRRLLAAYGIHHCLTRARLAIDHLRDTHVRMPAKWPARTRMYLAMARALSANTPAP